jgi:hypothetical protein
MSAEAPAWRPSRAAARRTATALACAIAFAGLAGTAGADKIANPTAVFDGLDKITGRIISFEVALNETVQFGTLQITPRICYSRPPTEAPQTDVFAEVDEIDEQKTVKRIFSGWMFADSPGLHGVEHPIYDVWLTACKGGTTVIRETPEVDASAPDMEAQPGDANDANGQPPPQAQAPAPQPKKRRPKPPTVVAAPSPPPADNNLAPLDLGGSSNLGNTHGR